MSETTSTGAVDSSSTGAPVDYCAVCGADEICVERGSDGCGFGPEIECITPPDGCAEPSCDDLACAEAICGETDCGGFGAQGCFGVTGAFLCWSGLGIQCDLWAQDCPRGERCSTWSHDGGTRFDATLCTPVADVTVGLGEACLVEGSPTSGIDNCEFGSQCLDADPDTLVGVCRSRCLGSRANPSCEDAALTCTVIGDSFAFCLP